jgi:hypothetical protein
VSSSAKEILAEIESLTSKPYKSQLSAELAEAQESKAAQQLKAAVRVFQDAARIHPLGGGPTRATTLPTDPAERKRYPVATGFLDYFPDAIAELANLSWHGNEQHNPGSPLRWDRSKSSDEDDTAMRHFLQRGTRDTDGKRHSAKAAWRMLAALQKEIEAEQR